MTKVSRTFRIDKRLSTALDKIYTRHGDNTFHVECALTQYKPIKDVLGKSEAEAKSSPPAAIITVPDGINPVAWIEWVEYRKTKKKKVSQKAATKQFKLLSNYAFDIQQQIIDQSIQNDYQGLFEPKGGSNAKNQPGRNASGHRLSAVERVAAKSKENRASRANNRHNLENAGGDIRQHDSHSLRGRDAGGMDSIIEGDYTQTDS